MSSNSDDHALEALRDLEAIEAMHGIVPDLNKPVPSIRHVNVLDHVQRGEPALRVGNPTAIPLNRSDATMMDEDDKQRFTRMANAWRGPRGNRYQGQYKGRTRTPMRRTWRKKRTYKRNPYKGYARRYTRYNNRAQRTYMRKPRYHRYGRYTRRYRRY